MSEIPRIRPPNKNVRFRAKIDGRTEVGLLMRQTREALVEHLGGEPTATQKVLIDRSVMLIVHLARMDTRALESGDEPEPTKYLAWSNTLSRLMKALGLGTPEPPKSTRPFWETEDEEPEPEKPSMSPEEMDRYRIKPKRLEAAE